MPQVSEPLTMGTLRREPSGDDEVRLFERSLSVRLDSVRDEDRSFETVMTTEERAVVFDWGEYEYIDEVLVASGARFRSHVPFLGGHRRHHELDVYGHVGDRRLEGDEWLGRVHVSEPANERDPVAIVWQRIRGKHLRAVSIGYWPLVYTDISPGESAMVDGRNWTAGERRLRLTTEWEVFELSAVAVGADPRALARARVNPTNQPQATATRGQFWGGDFR